MDHVDRQRICAVKTLREFRLAGHQGAWQKCARELFSWPSLMPWLVRRGDELEGCTPEFSRGG
jgi:hypothetical protein